MTVDFCWPTTNMMMTLFSRFVYFNFKIQDKKLFEKILKIRLSSFVKLNEYQFAYRKGRSTKDACLT